MSIRSMRMYLLQRMTIYSILLLTIHLLLFYLLLNIPASQYSYFSLTCFSVYLLLLYLLLIYLQLLDQDYWLRAHVHTHTRALLYATQLNSTPSTFSSFFLPPFGNVFSIIF